MHRTKFEHAHKRQVLSSHTLSAQEQCISERTRPVLCESKGNPRASREICAQAGKSAREQGDSRASREIRAQAGRFALAHYINLLSRYKNALSTFGSKITP